MSMTTGELDYDDIFHHREGEEEIPFPLISFPLWIIFLVMMPVLLNNYLVRRTFNYLYCLPIIVPNKLVVVHNTWLKAIPMFSINHHRCLDVVAWSGMQCLKLRVAFRSIRHTYFTTSDNTKLCSAVQNNGQGNASKAKKYTHHRHLVLVRFTVRHFRELQLCLYHK